MWGLLRLTPSRFLICTFYYHFNCFFVTSNYFVIVSILIINLEISCFQIRYYIIKIEICNWHGPSGPPYSMCFIEPGVRTWSSSFQYVVELYGHMVCPHLQVVTCCLGGRSQYWFYGSWTLIRSSSDLVLDLPSPSLPVAMVIAILLSHYIAMVSRFVLDYYRICSIATCDPM